MGGGASVCPGDPGRPATLGHVPSGSGDHACLHVCVCRWACLGACTCTSEGPKSRSCLAGCGVTWPAQEPSPAPRHREVQRPLPALQPSVLTRVLPFTDLSVHASGAYVDQWMDGQMDGWRTKPSFLPSSVHLWDPGRGPSSPQWSLSPPSLQQ